MNLAAAIITATDRMLMIAFSWPVKKFVWPFIADTFLLRCLGAVRFMFASVVDKSSIIPRYTLCKRIKDNTPHFIKYTLLYLLALNIIHYRIILQSPIKHKRGTMKNQATIKISTFTHQVLKDAKDFTGETITDIVNRLVKKEYPNKYK
jgi:hypothetical protein